MDTFLRDIRYAVRRLLRTPGFSAVAIASLGLGIGANTAIFSLVNAVLLPALPYERPDELVEVYVSSPEFAFSPMAYPDYRDVRDETEEAFTGVAAAKLTLAPRDLGDRTEMLPAELVSGNYFSLLGLRPQLGRLLGAEDDVAPGAHPVVVLSHAYWQRSFGGDPGVLGRTIRLSGREFSIVGVAPAAYAGQLRGVAPDVLLPIQMADIVEPTGDEGLEYRGARATFVRARLRPGITPAQAEAVVGRVATRLQAEHPRQWDAASGFVLVPTKDVIVNPVLDRIIVPAVGLLMVVVGLVLLIACANLASFLLARARDRRREVAIRLAIGARRGTLVRQLLTETVLLALVGGVIGVILSQWALGLLQAADLPVPVPITLDLSLDGRVLGFALAVSALAGVLFGLAPALQATNPNMASTLKDEAAGGGRARRVTLRDALVIGQVAVSIVLLVGAGLFLRSFQATQSVDPGFGQEPAAIAYLGLPPDRYHAETGLNFTRELMARLERLPEVERAGIMGNLHLNTLSTQMMRVNVDGHEPPDGRDAFPIDWSEADPAVFHAAGIRIVRGRGFGPTDERGSPPVAIISQAMAERFWPGEDPIGRTIRRPDGDLTVVGVAADAKVRTLGEAPRPFIYRPFSQEYSNIFFIVASTRGAAEPAAARILATVRELDPEIIVLETKTMDRHLAVMLLPAKLGAMAFSAFAVLALVLAILGLYGIVSYAVARRSREVGIRMALGAEAGEVVGMLMRQGLGLVVIGGVIGMALAALTTRALAGLVYGVAALDPITFIAVPVLLVGISTLAAYLPARRASRIDPVRVLRQE